MPAEKTGTTYTLEQAARDVGDLRGQLDRLSEILTQSDGALIPNAPPAGDYAQYATAGHMQYVSGQDGSAYDTGRQTQFLTGDVPVISTTPSAVFTFNVASGIAYRIHGVLKGLNGSSGTLQGQTMRLAGTASFSHIRVFVRSAQMGTATSTAAFDQITAVSQDPAAVRTPALNEHFSIEFDGIVVCSGTGTLIIQAREVLSGFDVNWTCQIYSFAEIMPVVA